MWLVVSLTLARATFQIKLALVSRLYSWCVPGSLGHRAETSANKGPMGVKEALEPGLPPRILSQQQMPARPVRGRPHLQTAAGSQEAYDKDLRHGYGGKSAGCFAQGTPSCRDTVTKPGAPFGTWLHSLAGPLLPRRHDAHRFAESAAQ